jgi:Pyruvate/2-oxoacid:ferredoxin oxidoreductase delta subunit
MSKTSNSSNLTAEQRLQIFKRHMDLVEKNNRTSPILKFVHRIFSNMEPQLLKIGNKSLDMLKNKRIWSRGLPRIIPWTMGKILHYSFFRAQVLTLDELKILIENLNKSSGDFIATIGACPCRKGMRIFSKEIPTCTDIQIFWHGPLYKSVNPDYQYISGADLSKRLDLFDKLGLVHTVFGFCYKEGTELALCNCDREVCFPLRAEIDKTFRITPGFAIMRVDPNKCYTACPNREKCMKICPVNARKLSKANQKIYVNRDCIGCGVCMNVCSKDANKLVPRKRKYIRMIPKVMAERS